MANLRDIRRRIRSVKNTAQITKAMQLVASSKMKRAQDAALAGRPYALALAGVLADLAPRLDEAALRHPFLAARPVKNRGIIILSTDKGLCGALNANLFRLVPARNEDARYFTVGRKATQYIARSGREVAADFAVTDRTSFGEVRPLIQLVTEQFINGEIDTIEVLFSDFINTLRQEPVLFPLLPLTHVDSVLKRLAERHHFDLGDHRDDREVLFEPAVGEILDQLLRQYVSKEIFHLVNEAKASEHSARMVAMKTATDNARDLVDDLTLQYNKVRQAAITQEILEIAAATASNT